PTQDVEVVDQHVLEDAARALDVVGGRRAGIAARHHEHFGIANLAIVDSCLQRGEGRIVATLKPNQAGDGGARDRLRTGACTVDTDSSLPVKFPTSTRATVRS